MTVAARSCSSLGSCYVERSMHPVLSSVEQDADPTASYISPVLGPLDPSNPTDSSQGMREVGSF